MSKRAFLINCHHVKADKSWRNSKIVFEEYEDAERIKKVTICVRDPWDLAAIEGQCRALRAYWQESCK